jgi:sporulation protein YlmC with PRC-barrel domain
MVQLSDLMGAEVRSHAGERLGHVGDVRVVRQGQTWEVDAILLGASSALERLGLRRGAPQAVAWTQVREIRDGVVTVDAVAKR